MEKWNGKVSSGWAFSLTKMPVSYTGYLGSIPDSSSLPVQAPGGSSGGLGNRIPVTHLRKPGLSSWLLAPGSALAQTQSSLGYSECLAHEPVNERWECSLLSLSFKLKGIRRVVKEVLSSSLGRCLVSYFLKKQLTWCGFFF